MNKKQIERSERADRWLSYLQFGFGVVILINSIRYNNLEGIVVIILGLIVFISGSWGLSKK